MRSWVGESWSQRITRVRVFNGSSQLVNALRHIVLCKFPFRAVSTKIELPADRTQYKKGPGLPTRCDKSQSAVKGQRITVRSPYCS